MKKGFTLLELIVVIIIVGVLATIGFTSYTKMAEKGKKAEGMNLLGSLRTAQAAYKLERDVYTDTIANLGLDTGAGLNTACATSGYFKYSCTTDGKCKATRCTASGTSKGTYTTEYTMELDQAGAWTLTSAP